jgi:hypothetical protein
MIIAAEPELRDAIQTAAETEANAPVVTVVGWWLGRDSWTFHRCFFAVCGRPMLKGE